MVVDEDAGTGSNGALFSVDPTTGQRTVLSDFNDPNQDALGNSPVGVAIGSSGNVLVIDADAGPIPLRGAFFSVDPTTGQRTLVSDFRDPNQGALGASPEGVAVVPASSARTCNGLPVTIKGTPGNDILPGTNGDDVIHGLGGHDIISAGNGNDTVCGGDGNDVISGGNGRDRLFGQGGDDVLSGGNGNDRLSGGSGRDVLSGGNGKDSLNGGVDNDTCDGGAGTDGAVNCETLVGVP